MKKIYLSLAFVVGFISISIAQDAIGIKAGLNLASEYIRIDNQSAKTKIAPSFHASIYYDAAINSKFSIQPAISLEGKGGISEIEGEKLTDKFLYIQVPVNFFGRIPTRSGDFFFGGGPYVAYGIDARVTSGRNAVHLDWGKDQDQLNPFDAGITASIGYRFLNGFAVSFSGSNGFVNISNASQGKYLNRVSSIGVAYEFNRR